MRTSDFDYTLPQELIAQEPAPIRDGCRLLVMDKRSGAIEDRVFRDLVDYVNPGDLLVVNETRVLPARLLGAKRGTGGAAEVLLLREVFDREPKTGTSAVWEALVKPGKRLKPGTGALVDVPGEDGTTALTIEVIDWGNADAAHADAAHVNGQSQGEGRLNADANEQEDTGSGAHDPGKASPRARGGRIVRLSTERPSLDEALHAVGHTPLPPYIHDYQGDEELYQTVYSRRERSAAAPTAGLHFTPELIEALKRKGAQWETVELEVGLDTFRIVDEEDPEQHQMHTELYTVPARTAEAIAQTKADGGRVIAVGTTSVRSLESAWNDDAHAVLPCERAATSLYLLPGSTFNVVDALITNFHVPRSTLMMLVSAFSSRDNVMRAYQHAIDERYRFFSFGDAMLLH